jgi:ATP-binding protein involved in chromosome partitioning
MFAANSPEALAALSIELSDRAAACLDPVVGVPLGALGAVRVAPAGAGWRVAVQLPFPVGGPAGGHAAALLPALAAVLGVEPAALTLELSAHIPTGAVQGQLTPLSGIRNVIAVASGKGGVGKSTVAVNLALALSAQGARVGLLDADIYGPSVPLLLGLQGERPLSRDGKSFDPLRAQGIEAISIGFLIDAEQPMVWRGPMVTQALTQLLSDTRWGELDYLLVDMPPGTGDIQLTLAQRVPVSGAIIVTTPQDIALLDARKGLKMFEKVQVPVLGIVENMAVHTCSQCGHSEAVFGEGGGERMAADYHVPLLGRLPLHRRIREDADAGCPTVAADPEGPVAVLYHAAARRAVAELALRTAPAGPVITADDT